MTQLTAKTVATSLSHKGKPQRVPGGYLTNCPGPSHKNGDKNPSLKIAENDQGHILWHCFAGCGQDDIRKELIARDLYTKDMAMGNDDHTPRSRPSRQPVQPCPDAKLPTYKDLPHIMLDYLQERGISHRTMDHFGLGWQEEERDDEGKIVKPSGIAFPYVAGDQLFHVKVRTQLADVKNNARKWWQTPGGGKIMFNYNELVEGRPTIITEGEFDALAVWQALDKAGLGDQYNVTSVPNGSSFPKDEHPEWLLHAADTLTKMPRFILMTDNDPSGLELRENLARVFGKERCWYVEWADGVKDANDALLFDGEDGLVYEVENATPWPMRNLQSAMQYAEEVLDLYKHGSQKGYTTGYPLIDAFYKVVPGELEVVTGVPGSGKSNWLDQVNVNISEKHGVRHAVCSFENPMDQHLATLAEKRIRKSFVGHNGFRLSEEELIAALQWIDRHWTFIRLDDEDHPTIDRILELARVAVIRFGIKTLTIDPWNYIEHSRKPGQSETEYVSEALSKMRRFAQNHDVHVYIVAHPPKLQKDKDGLIAAPTGYEIAGSANFYNKADVLTVVHRQPTVSPEKVQVIFRKVRFKTTGKPGVVEMEYLLASGSYIEQDIGSEEDE